MESRIRPCIEMNIVNLPTPIFSIVREYVVTLSLTSCQGSAILREGCEDWRSFVNSSRKEFSEIRKKFIVYNFGPTYSAHYLNFLNPLSSNDLITRDREVAERIHKTVVSPRSQILFDIRRNEIIDPLVPFQAYGVKLHDDNGLSSAEVFQNVYSVAIPIRYLTDFSWLRTVKILDIPNRISNIDFSFLLASSVMEINLSESPIVDVAPLRNIRRIQLRHCLHLEDVSSLHNVYEVNLDGCFNITDVSALGNVHILNLSYCGKLSDVSALGKVRSLDLSYCISVVDVSALSNVSALNIVECRAIQDVSALVTVKRLKISNNLECTRDLTESENYVEIHCAGPVALPMLQNMKNKANKKIILDFLYCEDVTQADFSSFLDGYHDVQFSRSFLRTFSDFQSLRRIEFSGFARPEVIENLPALETLILTGVCYNFPIIRYETLPNLIFLQIERMYSNNKKRITIDGNIKQLVLRKCEGGSIYINSHIEALTTLHCSFKFSIYCGANARIEKYRPLYGNPQFMDVR
jgi:hypothetical protein